MVTNVVSQTEQEKYDDTRKASIGTNIIAGDKNKQCPNGRNNCIFSNHHNEDEGIGRAPYPIDWSGISQEIANDKQLRIYAKNGA